MNVEEINCHFVTESLTDPWRVRNKDVYYYDFTSGQICTDSIANLFALKNTNSREIEQLISKYVESPIGKYKASLVGKHNPELIKTPVYSISDWSVYRAFHLYFVIQLTRFEKAKLAQAGTDYVSKLDEILLKGETYLDQLAQVRAIEYDITCIQLPNGYGFYFPETGFFQFPLEDNKCVTKIGYGYAVPLTPFVCLALIPKSTNRDALLANRAQISMFSLGLNQNVSKAIIPPQAFDNNSKEEVERIIKEARFGAEQIAQANVQLRELIAKSWEIAGFKLVPIDPLKELKDKS